MTFNPMAGRAVIEIRPILPESPSVIELGSQTLSFRLKDNPEIEDVLGFYRHLKFERYASIDLDGKSTHAMDLNHDLLEKYGFTDTYDLVTNNGTGEHVFDQGRVFLNCHRLCKTGGIMLHVLPWLNWRNHGFYNFNPVLFRDLAAANNYEIVRMFAGTRDGKVLAPEIGFDEVKKPDAVTENVMLVVALRKGPSDHFNAPFQGKYAALAQQVYRAGVLTDIREISLDPFPHVVAKGPEGLFRELEAIWPDPSQWCGPAPNKLYQWAAKDVLASDIQPLWKEFFVYHATSAFLQEVFRLFGSEIAKRYSMIAELPAEGGVRGSGATAPFRMDCQFAANTPTTKRTKVRGPHVDDPRELYAGLWYFDGDGGDLELYRWTKKRKFVGREGMTKKAECDPGSVKLVKRIQTEPNTLVFFLNTPDSIHGVTRRKSDNYRRYINIIGEIDAPLFELK